MLPTRLPHVTYQQQVDQQKQRQRGRVPVPLITGLALLLVLAGVGVTWLLMRDSAAVPSEAAVAATPSPAATGSTAPVVAPTMAASTTAAAADPGELACARLDVKSTDWKALQALGEQAASSGNDDVARRGKLLESYADIAVHAQGAGDEAKSEASATKAAESLRTSCLRAGYKGAA